MSGEAYPAEATYLRDSEEEEVSLFVKIRGEEYPVTGLEIWSSEDPLLLEPSWGAITDLSNSRITTIKSRLGTTPWSTAYNRLLTAGSAREVPSIRPATPFATAGLYTPAPVPVLEDIVTSANSHSPAKNNEPIQLHPWCDDGVAAYTQALLWHLTDNTAYRDNAIRIIEAWGSVLEYVEGRNQITPNGKGGIEAAKLASAWAVPQYCKAIDLLTRRGVDCSEMIDTLQAAVYPQLDWTSSGNVAASLCEARLSLSIVRRDPIAFYEAIEYIRFRVRQIFGMSTDSETDRRVVDYYYPSRPIPDGVFIAGQGVTTNDKTAQWWRFSNAENATWINGISPESARDISHLMMGMAGLANTFETAYASGVDLWSENSDRIASALELHSAWLREAIRHKTVNGLSDSAMDASNWTPTGRFGSSGIPDDLGVAWPFQLGTWKWAGTGWQSGWEIAYSRLSPDYELPNTRAILAGWNDGNSYNGTRAVPPRATLHMAYETLTHGVPIT